MRNIHPNDTLLAEALGRWDIRQYLLKIGGRDTNLLSFMTVALLVSSQGPDRYRLATQLPLSNIREITIGNHTRSHAEGLSIDLVMGRNLSRVICKRSHRADSMTPILARDFPIAQDLIRGCDVNYT